MLKKESNFVRFYHNALVPSAYQATSSESTVELKEKSVRLGIFHFADKVQQSFTKIASFNMALKLPTLVAL